MGCVDRTEEFRSKVKDLARSYSPPPSKKRRRTSDKSSKAEGVEEDGFLTEAYAILKHISTLTDLLGNIRRAYLNVDVTSTNYAQRSLDMNSSSAWSSVKSLSNEERDQIDLQARIILMQCADRVSKLEQHERARSKTAIAKSNPLHTFFPSLLPPTTSLVMSELVTAHRSSITWYLTRRLAETSAAQKDMQEERVKRQLERAQSLGGSSTRGLPGQASTSTSFASSSFQYVPPPVISSSSYPLVLDSDDSDFDELDDAELTPAQIQQFEEENAAILRQQESLLSSIKQAESRLLDISALQTELVVQLQRQSEQVDTLYDEAIASQSEVERGNEQLRRARERARSSRKWILMFIWFATFCLLFLHWYD